MTVGIDVTGQMILDSGHLGGTVLPAPLQLFRISQIMSEGLRPLSMSSTEARELSPTRRLHSKETEADFKGGRAKFPL